jgi:hypothetical protein
MHHAKSFGIFNFLLTSVANPATGLLPHSYMVDSAVLCCEGHPGILPLLPHLAGINLESLRCIFRFHHVMDVLDDDHIVVLHALQLGLQSASYPL